MTLYGIIERARDSGRGRYIQAWSGSFMSTWEADGFPRDGAKRVTLTTYNNDKVIVRLPEGTTFPRTIDNFPEIDAAINAALNEYEQKRGSIQILPDSRSAAEMRAENEVLVTWRVTEETTYQATMSRATYEQMNTDGDLAELVALEGEEAATVLSDGVTERIITEYEIAHDSEREVTETEDTIPDLPPGDDGRPTEHPDPAAPGADDI
ncbi:hypothetical protein SEA_RUDY_85 [Microbacterium phage Rudy]|nr:hypothetical protein SEA_RUDY_85 [Microbacterium phage Rudy]QWY80572.1 hypothetical protein SEA_QUAMMI_86 [Microbacterium phage Quammi]UVG33930.1 hypothetical protein SEA_VICEROY_85 [Microbacterium phage Viceroy]